MGDTEKTKDQLLAELAILQQRVSQLETTEAMHKQERKVLVDECDLLSTVLNNIPTQIYVKDTQSRFIFANTETVRALRVASVEEYIGKTDLDLMLHSPEKAAAYFAEERKILQTGEAIIDKEHASYTEDNRTMWSSTSKIALRDAEGNITGIVGIGQDITERKLAEEALHNSEELYRTLVQNMPDSAVILYDHDLRFILVDGHEVDRSGYSKTEMEGRTLHEALPPEFAQMVEPNMLAALDGQAFAAELPWGEDQFYLYTYVPIANDAGEITKAMILSQNITERKQAERHALALLLERERMKILTNFITKAAHQFKTPLSIINISTYLIRKATTDEARSIQILKIEAQVNAINTLINGMTTMSKIDGGQALFLETININRIIREVWKTRKHLSDEKNLNVILSLCEEPLSLQADYDHLRQSIGNIIHNAIRYTQEGGTITIQSSIIDDNAVIEITDTGVGIGDEDLPNIFERFYRGDVAGTTRGFGLGLPIAKAIIERHEGSIEVETKAGQGSIFRVILPLDGTRMNDW
jgi:two-component system, sensor histidine kinase and response regulator